MLPLLLEVENQITCSLTYLLNYDKKPTLEYFSSNNLRFHVLNAMTEISYAANKG